MPAEFLDSDRPFLMRAFELARAAVRPPLRLGSKPEPAWAAVVAAEGKEVVSAAFSPGDREDAVKKLLPRFERLAHPEATLYLTLEPKAGFQRLPPVTESIRRLGVKRVVIGTLDPAERYRGEGQRTLEQGGVEVVLADGEEARYCQMLLDDYAKWLQKGLAVLRAQVSLESHDDGSLDLKFSAARARADADAVIGRAGGTRTEIGEAWRVVIDPEGWEKPAERTVLYQAIPSVPGARVLPLRDGAPDLGAVLRDLGSLGFLTAELAGDAELFRLAVRANLLDSVTAGFDGAYDSHRVLSQLDRVKVAGGGDPLEIKLNGARLVEGHLEAGVELC